MSIMTTRLLLCGLLLALSLGAGLLLSRAGRPLNSAIFTLHKLSALATLILFVISAYRLHRGADVSSRLPVAAAIALLFLLALFVSGSLLAFDRFATATVLRIHQAATLLMVASVPLVVYALAANEGVALLGMGK